MILILISLLTIYYTIPTNYDPEEGSFENIVGEGENAISNGFCTKDQHCFAMCDLITGWHGKQMHKSLNGEKHRNS